MDFCAISDSTVRLTYLSVYFVNLFLSTAVNVFPVYGVLFKGIFYTNLLVSSSLLRNF